MTKKEIQKRVLQSGKPLALNKFTWDEKTNTFSSNEDNLVIDFNHMHCCTFKTGHHCIFNTGNYCTFNTIHDCMFETGHHCVFHTTSYCIFKTGSYCTFDTGFDCMFNTSHNCTFKTQNNCRFITGVYCTFKTGNNCKFTTDYNCTFNTEYDCTFNTDSGCVFNTGCTCIFNTGCTCIFNTGYNCTFNTSHNCTFNCYKTAIIINNSLNNVLMLRDTFTNEFYNLDTLEKDKMICYNIHGNPIVKQSKKVEIIDSQIIVINSKKRFRGYQIYSAQDIGHYLNDIDMTFKIVSKEYNGKTYYAHCENTKKGIEDVNFKIARINYNLNEIAQQIKNKNNMINWYDYRLITGACEFGTKQWLEQNKYTTDDTININEFYEKYKEQHPYGFGKFEEFYEEWF